VAILRGLLASFQSASATKPSTKTN